MIWCRFYINIKEVKEDYRPVIWPIKYPYWLSGESETAYIICAYADSEEDIYKQWPEAYDLDTEEVKSIEFSERFPKPDWYREEPIMKDKKLIVKFTVIAETDTSCVLGDTYEEKLKNWKHDVEEALDMNIHHWGETSYSIDCDESKIEDYDE